MRPVVFGPSPLMEAALGVFKGQELGRKRVRDEEDRDDELAKRSRGAELDALTIAQRTIANDTQTAANRQRQTREATATAAAERLRASEFNADGKYGRPGEPVDLEHDYEADFEKEAKIRATKRALIAQGMPEDKAEDAARYDVDEQGMVDQRATAKEKRERAAADLARVKAETAATWARANNGGSSGGSNPRLDRQINDQEQVASAAARAVPTKREGMAQIIAGQPLDEGIAAAFTADSTAKAGAASTERARLDALKSVRGDPDVMRRGGYGGNAPVPEAIANANTQAMTAELTAIAERVQRILTHPRATEEQKAAARDELSRQQTLIVQKYQGETR